MTMTTFTDALTKIADDVREIVCDPALRPNFAPAELLNAVLAYPQAGGKALRPALLTWSCLALGGQRAPALRAGVSAELYHTYTLVHDDVIDRDPMRRGNPSVHALMEEVGRRQYNLDEDASHYGLSMAVLAGDCLQSWSIDLLASLPELAVDPYVTLQLVRRLQGVTGPAIVEGEARDIQLPFLPVSQVSADDILRVILTKTSALFAYCGWAGGLLARGEEDHDVRELAAFSERAGIAFQLQDDVLGIIGDMRKLGKPVGGDLREGKRTMIIALAWERADEEEREALADVLGNPLATAEEIAVASHILIHLDAVHDVQAMADSIMDEALLHLSRLPDNTATSLLRELAVTMVRREK